MTKERRGIHLIAELANVSIGTVDRALHGRPGINEETRQRILQVARQVGYTPNLAARALSASKSNLKIGVCVPREIHFFYDQLWSGILDEERRAGNLGMQFVNRPVQVLGQGDTQAFKELVEAAVDGLLPLPPQFGAVSHVIGQPAQGRRQVARVVGVDQQPAAGRLQQFGERPVARLHHRHPVRQRLQHVQPLRLAVRRRHRQHVNRVQEAHLVVVRRRLDVVEVLAEAGVVDLLPQGVEVVPVVAAASRLRP